MLATETLYVANIYLAKKLNLQVAMDMNYQTFECSKTLYVANTSLAKKLNLQVAIWK